MILIDEVLTPDSSRFWDASTYEPGRAQDSYDKQYVRDYLETLDWGKTYPGPELPAEVVAGHAQALRRGIRAHHGRLVRPLPVGGRRRLMSSYRFSVSIMPRDGILDPAGKAVEAALPQLHADNVHEVRVGRRVELTVQADSSEARARPSTRWPPTSWPIR